MAARKPVATVISSSSNICCKPALMKARVRCTIKRLLWITANVPGSESAGSWASKPVKIVTLRDDPVSQGDGLQPACD